MTSDLVSAYKEMLHIKKVARAYNIAPSTVRKILITESVYASNMSRTVCELCAEGKTIDEIASILNIRVKTVWCYIPYTKGSYVLGQKSVNAMRISKYRAKKREQNKGYND